MVGSAIMIGCRVTAIVRPNQQRGKMPPYGNLKFPRRQYLRRARYSTFSNSKLNIAERLRRVETRKSGTTGLSPPQPGAGRNWYLASGKPAVMQHTGPSRMLPTEPACFVLKIYHRGMIV